MQCDCVIPNVNSFVQVEFAKTPHFFSFLIAQQVCAFVLERITQLFS